MAENANSYMDIKWHDAGVEPQCEPNPDYPSGIDLDMTRGESVFCNVTLPYPAKRCGIYYVDCSLCGIRVACTTAGRPDDPRSVRIPCKGLGDRKI